MIHCIFPSCNYKAKYNYPNETTKLYCGFHKFNGMFIVSKKLCIHCQDEYGHKQFKDYCQNCFFRVVVMNKLYTITSNLDDLFNNLK